MKKRYVYFLLCSLVVVIFAPIAVSLYFSSYPKHEITADEEVGGITDAVLHGPAPNGGSYNISVSDAVQMHSSIYQLKFITAQYYLDAAKKKYLSFSSDSGELDISRNLLILNKDITGVSDDGYKLIAANLNIDFNKKTIDSTTQASLIGTLGGFKSDNGFVASLTDSKVVLHGPIETNYRGIKSLAVITLTSDKANVDTQNKIIEYIGNILISGGNSNLKCNKVIASFLLDGSNNVVILSANFLGNVIITSNTRIARADSALFDSKSDLITLNGNIQFKDQNYYVEGGKVTYDIKTGVFKITSLTKHASKTISPGVKVMVN